MHKLTILDAENKDISPRYSQPYLSSLSKFREMILTIALSNFSYVFIKELLYFTCFRCSKVKIGLQFSGIQC